MTALMLHTVPLCPSLPPVVLDLEALPVGNPATNAAAAALQPPLLLPPSLPVPPRPIYLESQYLFRYRSQSPSAPTPLTEPRPPNHLCLRLLGGTYACSTPVRSRCWPCLSVVTCRQGGLPPMLGLS